MMDNASIQTKGPESIIRPIKDKIRAYCKQNRVRLVEFFRTFDVHRTKKVSRAQFNRALLLALEKLQLTDKEMDLLATRYQVPGQPDMVQYLKFADQIDKVFVIKDLEKNPLRNVNLHTAGDPNKRLGLENPALGAIEVEELREVLTTIQHIAQTQGVILKMFFADFDHSNNGCVSREQFLRSMSTIVGTNLTNYDMQLVAKAYELGSSGISYRTLHEAVTPAGLPNPEEIQSSASVHPAPELPYSVEGVRRNSEADDLTKLEKRLALQMQQRRMFLTDHFREFDRNRLGYCTRTEFTQVIGRNFALNVSEDQLEAIMHKYRFGNKVRYPAFISNLDKLAGRSAEIIPGSPIQTAPLRKPMLSPNERSALIEYLKNARKYVTTKRILLKPPFQDFDPRREEHITREQFCRVLSMFDILPSNSYLQEVVLKAYASTDHRHPASSFVNYKVFLNDMESPGDGGDLTSQTLEQGSRPGSRSGRIGAGANMIVGAPTPVNTLERPKPNEPLRRKISDGTMAASLAFQRQDRSLEQVLAEIQNKVLSSRLRMQEYFQDIDKLRHGLVTVAQFRRALGQYGFHFTQGEYNALLDRYGRQSRSGGQEMVSYVQFVAEVETVFGIQGLEKDPTLDVDRALSMTQSVMMAQGLEGGGASPTVNGSMAAGALSENDRQTLAHVMREMARQVAHRRLELKPPFQDFDRLHRGYISATMFERVLSRLGILPDAAGCEILKKKFKEQNMDGGQDVNYTAFIAALELVMEGAQVDEIQTAFEYRQAVREKTTNFQSEKSFDNVSLGRTLNSLALEEQDPTTDLQVVLKEIRRQISAKRVKLYDFVSEGDKYRSGEISEPKFHSALAVAGLQLTQRQLDLLTATYSSDKKKNLVDWKVFLKKVTNTEDFSGWAQDDISAQAEIEELLDRIRTYTRHRSLFLRPYFQDYDRNHNWQVTKTQMFSVLDNLGLKLSDTDRELLFNAFTVKEGVRGTNRINYKEFVRLVDDVEET